MPVAAGCAAQCPAGGLAIQNILTGKPALGQGLGVQLESCRAGELEVTHGEAEGH